MTDTQSGVVVALALLAYLTLLAVICRTPRLCQSCGLPCPRRHIVRHLTTDCPAITQEPTHV